MKKIYFLLLFVSNFFASEAQIKVKFELKDIPKHKGIASEYFMAGSFNGWKPNDTNYRFKKLEGGSYSLEKFFLAANYEFKITRGDWAKAESEVNGSEKANRRLVLNKDTVVKISISNWIDEFEKLAPKHTASVNVHLLDTAFLIPQLNKKRRIWIYLPPSYAMAKNKYPVLYMNDGQNLFDELTSGYGEWKIDEILDEFIAKGGKECIVVGIDHGGTDRLIEYNPYDSEYGKGQGKAYIEFLVNTLKPFVDEHYRTKTSSKNTTIAGSSMGGLIATYAIANYPKVFGNAGVFSPAFWIAEPLINEVKKKAIALKAHKIYFVAGELESKTMVSDMKSIYEIINPSGKNNKIKYVTKADGEHKEWFWSKEFLDFYKFIAK